MILKSQFYSFDKFIWIVLNVYNLIWIASNSAFLSARYYGQSHSEPGPTEIISAQHGRLSKAQREQHKKGLEAGACFRCLKVGCRVLICRPMINHVKSFDVAIKVDLSDSDSEE